MKFIFHLGTYKTGTSSLQNFLFAHRDQLAAEGICYPKTGAVRDGRLGHRHRRIIDYVRDTGRTEILQTVLAEAKAGRCETVFLSCEAWAHPGNLRALTQTVYALKDLGVTAFEAAITFRNVADYQVSIYREFTHNQRNSIAYPNYSEQRRAWTNYVFLLQNFRALFADRLHVLRLKIWPTAELICFKRLA